MSFARDFKMLLFEYYENFIVAFMLIAAVLQVETAKEEVNAVAQACSSNEMPSIGVWPGLRPKETSAQRRARRIRNRKSERETDSEENPLVADLRSLGTAYDIQK